MLKFASNTKFIYKSVFIISIIIIGIMMMLSSQNIGFNSDNLDGHNYGIRALKFYKSFGNDTSYLLTYPGPYGGDEMRNYGSAFHIICASITSFFSEKYIYDLRHFISVGFGLLLILFVGLICTSFFDLKCGIIAIWLMYLCPVVTGFSYFDDKDLPMAASYIAAIYFIIQYLMNIKKPKFIIIIGVIISIGFAIGVRILGFFLIFYLALFTIIILFNKEFKLKLLDKKILKIIFRTSIICICAYCVGILFYPYLISSDHYSRLIEVIGILSKFPHTGQAIFKGELIYSHEIPSLFDYIFTFLKYQIPISVIIGLILLVPSLIFYYKNNSFKNTKSLILILIIFSIVFPLSIVLLKDAIIYGHIRHLLFVFPPIVVLSSISLYYFIKVNKSKIMKYIVVTSVIFFMLKTGHWMKNASPYHYLYFNEFAGMFKKAGNTFARDFHKISVRECFNYLTENENIFHNKKNVVIASNASWQLDILVRNYYGDKAKNIKVIRNGYKGFSLKYWDYAIMLDQFFPPVVRKSFFPMPNTIYEANLDGLPLSCLVKNPERNDFYGIKYIQFGSFKKGLSLLEEVYKKHKNYITIYPWLSYAYSETNQIKKAIHFYNLSIKNKVITMPDLKNLIIGNICYFQKQYKEANKYYSHIIKNIKKVDYKVYYRASMSLYHLNKFDEAKPLIEILKKNYPNMAGTKELINLSK